jgi:hypothetical protein
MYCEDLISILQAMDTRGNCGHLLDDNAEPIEFKQGYRMSLGDREGKECVLGKRCSTRYREKGKVHV